MQDKKKSRAELLKEYQAEANKRKTGPPGATKRAGAEALAETA